MMRTSGRRTFIYVHRLTQIAVEIVPMKNPGTIDNLSRNQLGAEGEATVLRGPHERERIGGYEETEDTLEDTSEVTTSSAGGELVVSAGPSHATTFSTSPVSTHLPRVSKRRSSSSKSVAST